jgi:hypothetical protein
MAPAESLSGQGRNIPRPPFANGRKRLNALWSALTAALVFGRKVRGPHSVVAAVNEHVLPEPIAVYNLKVAEDYAPEYYANGVLVHNCLWTPDGESPNRLDALVWALTELKIWTPPLQGGRRTSVPRGILPSGGLDRVRDGPLTVGR